MHDVCVSARCIARACVHQTSHVRIRTHSRAHTHTHVIIGCNHACRPGKKDDMRSSILELIKAEMIKFSYDGMVLEYQDAYPKVN